MLLIDEFDSKDLNLPVRIEKFGRYTAAIEVSAFSKFSLIP